MHKALAVLLGALIVFSPALAAGLFEDLQGMAERYNANIDRVPGFIRFLAGNERINAEIALESGGNTIVGIETKNGRVVNFARGQLQSPTMIVKTSERTIQSILAARNPAAAGMAALDNGAITYKSTNIFSRVKHFFGRLGIGILGRLVMPPGMAELYNYITDVPSVGSVSGALLATIADKFAAKLG